MAAWVELGCGATIGGHNAWWILSSYMLDSAIYPVMAGSYMEKFASAFGWEMMGEAAPPRRTWVARTVGAPKRLVPEADGKNSAEARVAKSFKLTF